jgi:CRP-like cAMP-binding protein
MPSEHFGPAADDLVLQGLDAAQWQAFAVFAESLGFAPGQVILQAGDIGRAVYLIRSGHVAAAVPAAKQGQKGQTGQPAGKPLLMGPGSVFGELAFFDAAPRSASVWAQDAVELWGLPFAAFERLAAAHPRIAQVLLLDLGRVLATRLRRSEAQA